jgi:hypothetical protein
MRCDHPLRIFNISTYFADNIRELEMFSFSINKLSERTNAVIFGYVLSPHLFLLSTM